MEFNAFIDQAWADHADNAAAVAARLPQALVAVTEAAQATSLAHLAQHVQGAHLGAWQDAIAFQQRLAALPVCAAGSAEAQTIERYTSALRLAGQVGEAQRGADASERVRISALAAILLADHDSARAARLLEAARADAEAADLPGSDPCQRALAVAGNNIAASLEEKPTRNEEERRLMILAAQVGRKHWALAGSWLEIERAEYRLAMSWLKAGETAQARQHAQNCIEIVQANGSVALEGFFGWEALGTVERHAGNPTGHAQALDQAEAAFAALAADDQIWCRASLDRLRAR